MQPSFVDERGPNGWTARARDLLDLPVHFSNDSAPDFTTTLDFDKKAQFHQGGNSAGPVFRRIAKGALRYLMIPPDRPEELEEVMGEDEYDDIMDERSKKYDAKSLDA